MATSDDLGPDMLRTKEEFLSTIPWFDDPKVRADMTFFECPNGGAVFSTGSITYAASLSHNNYDNNIARLTLPYSTDTASGDSGFQDITFFNLATFDQPWGRYGAGVVALLPTGSSDLTADKWGLGPALGFVAQPSWGLFGLFNQAWDPATIILAMAIS